MQKATQIVAILNELEQERNFLFHTYRSMIMWLITAPLLAAVALGIFFNSFPAFLITIFLGGLISYGIYNDKVGQPFKSLKHNYKETLLREFMKLYHPDIQYSYQPEQMYAEDILRRTELISAHKYEEEDVIQGMLNNTNKFYLSEIHLKKKGKNSYYTIFKGFLFRIKLPGRNYPYSRIESNANFVKRLFKGMLKNEEYGFYFDSHDVDRFEKELSPLFPFIRHLARYDNDVRVEINGDEMVMLLESKEEFLDDPKPNLQSSFLDDHYFQNLGKQINSMLYILESMAYNLNADTISEKLELKALEFARIYEEKESLYK